MRLYYRLYEEDYLQHQLYLASISKRVENKRKRNYFWITVLFAVIAVLAVVLQNNVLAILSLITTVITIIFYPIYERKHYKKHYLEFIKENYSSKQDENSYIEFKEHELVIHNDHSETTMDYSKIDRIVEIKDYIFVRIGATSLIIPNGRIENIDEVRDRLMTLAESQSKEYIKNLNWKWK
jgi:c-di-AMP phosphodiesterase-like protein